MAARATPKASKPLIREVIAALRSAADPEKAGPMQAYMKSAMPYLGVQTPQLRAAAKQVYGARRLDGFASWRDTVLSLWRNAKYRGERYAAVELIGHRFYREHRTLDALPLYEEIVVTGAWWDFVDAVATQLLFELIVSDRPATSRAMRAWSRSDDVWKRRSAILCQIKCKADTDRDLLYETIEGVMDEEEFFLRKAIGWALREYAKTDAAEVIRFVNKHRRRLSPLSKREALRICLKDGLIDSIP